jgi:hypothetical protein
VQQRTGVAASMLTAPLVDGPARRLHVVHASRFAWQLAGDDDLVLTCVMLPGAVRLPSGIALATTAATPSSVSVGDGVVEVDGRPLPVTRWWRPARPRAALLRDRVAAGVLHALALRVPRMVGLGGGLTPYADDVVCGALIAGSAAGAPETADLVDAVRRIDLERRTTATSALLLRLATEGWCIDELAAYVAALARDERVSEARHRLLRVGHSSGAGLLAGIHEVIPWRGSREEMVA